MSVCIFHDQHHKLITLNTSGALGEAEVKRNCRTFSAFGPVLQMPVCPRPVGGAEFAPRLKRSVCSAVGPTTGGGSFGSNGASPWLTSWVSRRCCFDRWLRIRSSTVSLPPDFPSPSLVHAARKVLSAHCSCSSIYYQVALLGQCLFSFFGLWWQLFLIQGVFTLKIGYVHVFIRIATNSGCNCCGCGFTGGG